MTGEQKTKLHGISVTSVNQYASNTLQKLSQQSFSVIDYWTLLASYCHLSVCDAVFCG